MRRARPHGKRASTNASAPRNDAKYAAVRTCVSTPSPDRMADTAERRVMLIFAARDKFDGRLVTDGRVRPK